VAAEINRVIKYNPTSGRLHEHLGFKFFVTWTTYCWYAPCAV